MAASSSASNTTLTRAQRRRGTIACVPRPSTQISSLALRLADAADAITTARFRARDLVVERKPDRTPVTDADVGGRGRDPRAARRRASRTTRWSARSAAARRAPAGPGCSTRSTAPRTSLRGVPRVGDVDRAGRGRRAGGRAWSARPRWAGAGGPRRAAARAPRTRPGRARRDLGVRACATWPTPTCPPPTWLRGSSTTRARRTWRWSTRAGRTARSATSGSTAWSPRARSTWPRSPIVEPVGRRARSRCWCARRAAGSATSAASPRFDGGTVLSTNGHLHDAALKVLAESR